MRRSLADLFLSRLFVVLRELRGHPAAFMRGSRCKASLGCTPVRHADYCRAGNLIVFKNKLPYFLY